MTERVRSLRDFLAEFVDEHAIADGSSSSSDELLLDVTPEEAEDLGVFFVRGMCGWMHGLRRMRAAAAAEQSSAEVSGEAADETLEGISEVEAEFIQ